MRLVDELGFDPDDGGGLDDSWRPQRGTPVYDPQQRCGSSEACLDGGSPERQPEWRETANSYVSSARRA